MRSDARIRCDVQAMLERDETLAAQPLAVEVQHGTVLFRGTLASHAQKRAVERSVLCVAGVAAVVFETRIDLDADTRPQDLRIADTVARMLQGSLGPAADDVRATIEQGWVMLHGAVRWDFERQEAERAARLVRDVQGVTNAIALHPVAVRGDVERNVHDALMQQARREGHGIEVVMQGATVTLRGCVHSDAEREAARNAALFSAGVDEVVNALVVRR